MRPSEHSRHYHHAEFRTVQRWHGIERERNRTLDLELHRPGWRQHGAVFGSAGAESARQRSVWASKRSRHYHHTDFRTVQRRHGIDRERNRTLELDLHRQRGRQHGAVFRSAGADSARQRSVWASKRRCDQ